MTTASKITMVRLLMIPVFVFFLMIGYYYPDLIAFSDYIAAFLFIIASATDGIDGHIARKYNQVTDFGKFIDPLADKILVVAALICMVEFGWIYSVAVIIIIAREFMVTGLRLVAISSGKVIAAGMSGKLKTVIQIVVISAILFAHCFGVSEISYISISLKIGIWVMVFITVYSGCEYIIKNWSVIDFNK